MPILLDTGPSPRGFHRLENFRRCKQLYAFTHVLHVPMEVTDPLIRGTLGHVGLAHLYARMRAIQTGQDPEVFYPPHEAIALAAKAHGALYPPWIEAVQAALAAYEAEFWAVELRTRRILFVEEFYDALIRGHRFTQRIDLGWEDRSGLVWLDDHKTTTAWMSDTIMDRYTLSGQFLALQTYGRAVWGAKFGGARVALIRFDADGTYKFRRIQPDPAPHALAKFPQNVVDTEEEIARWEASGRDPWLWPQAESEFLCRNVYSRCPAYDLCRWGPETLASHTATVAAQTPPAARPPVPPTVDLNLVRLAFRRETQAQGGPPVVL